MLGLMEPATAWKPVETFPLIASAGMKRCIFDVETDGVDVYGDSLPVGFGVGTEDGRYHYLPFGHRGGGNLDRGKVLNWAQREIRDCCVTMAEAKFDLGMSRKVGIDLEKQNCKPQEIQYRAALLNDYRRSFKLNDLAMHYVGRGKKEIEHHLIADLPASVVGPYNEMDLQLTDDVFKVTDAQIDSQGLRTVCELEDDIIYATMEMERNGGRLDIPKLGGWRTEVRQQIEACVMEVYEQTGLRINPDATRDMERVFRAQDISFSQTATGLGSFTDEFLRSFPKDSVPGRLRRARALGSVKSKYLDKYWRERDGEILRYKLHQLKGDDYGTIAGRYSSSSINIQQVFAPRRQAKKLGVAEYIIRELFIPDDGYTWVKADASQIEFRLFAHYSKSKKLIEAYLENPDIDFHIKVAELMSQDRDDAKNLNFGMLYCMGKDKLARSLGRTREESDKLYAEYNQMFPEVRKLIYEAINIAEQRGWVKTILGRRARFIPKDYETTDTADEVLTYSDRYHIALNRVIQGSAADILKLKLRDLYRERKSLGIHKIRFTVHDEFDFDVDSPARVVNIKQFLDRDLGLGIRVPLTWEVKSGPNWAAAA